VIASSLSFPDRERRDMADLLETLGPDAPTCCAGWSTAHLAAHVVVRDRRLDALPGFGAEGLGTGKPLSAWAHRLEDRLRETTGYRDVVARLRSGPRPWSPMAWPAVARAINVAEFAIHHEDVRRAQPGWEPRALTRAEQDQLWSASAFFARRVAGSRGLVLRRADAPGVERRLGEGGRTVDGAPMELLMWLSGRRDVARVAVS
jgi:uncharacterized protein (TIGR03085 family)